MAIFARRFNILIVVIPQKRSKAGLFLKTEFPSLYTLINGFRSKILHFFLNKEPFITDSLGGNFKHYIQQGDLSSLKGKLYQDLDNTSIRELDIVIDRLLKLPDYSEFIQTRQKYKLFNTAIRLNPSLPVESASSIKEIRKELRASEKTIKNIEFEPSVGYFFHGLRLLPSKVSDYIANGDFLDIGAYNGDSAISLLTYKYRKIFSFDISSRSVALYKNNMKANGIPDNKYLLTQAAVGSKSGDEIQLVDTGSPGLSVNRKDRQGDIITVPTITIDEFCSANLITPRLIKADMEGHAMEFVKGGLQTILASRPVLLIAIYHNPVEFFEIKPFLAEKLTNYTYIIRKISPGVTRNECHSEVFLIAYPSELTKL